MFCVLKLSLGKNPLVTNIRPKTTNINPSVFLVFTIIVGVSFFLSCLASTIFIRSVKKYAKIKTEKKIILCNDLELLFMRKNKDTQKLWMLNDFEYQLYTLYILSTN